jgi:predicted transcriptional regulator
MSGVRLGSGGLLNQRKVITPIAEKTKQTAVKKDISTKKDSQAQQQNVITINAKDLVRLIKPERVAILNYIRKNTQVLLTDLIKWSGRSRMSINNDIKILAQHKLIITDDVVNPSHGMRKIISTPHTEKVTIQTKI